MDAFIYQADLYCYDCGVAIRERLTAEGKAPANPDAEDTYDSNEFPKGPYPDGGGEADSPWHCGSNGGCLNAEDTGTPEPPDGWGKVGCMLENPLTEDGIDYVKDAIRDRAHRNPVTRMWAAYYTERYDMKYDDEE